MYPSLLATALLAAAIGIAFTLALVKAFVRARHHCASTGGDFRRRRIS